MNQLYPIIRRIRRPLIDDRMEIPQAVAVPVPPVVANEPVVEEATVPELPATEAPVPEPVPAEAPVAPVEEAPLAIEAPVPKRKKKNGDTAQN